MNYLHFKKISPYAQVPTKATKHSTGYDIYSSEYVILPPGGFRTVSTGLILNMKGVSRSVDITVRPRSGLAAKYGVTVLNAPGTIDLDYEEELKIVLINHGPEQYLVNIGDRIAQLVFNTAATVNLRTIEDDARDELAVRRGGFGSTGK